jgi:hypothetical protein
MERCACHSASRRCIFWRGFNAAIEFRAPIQRADLRQPVDLVLAQPGNAQRQIVDAGERPRAQDGAGSLFAQPLGIAQAEAQGRGMPRRYRAQPVRFMHIHRQHAQPVPLRVFNQDAGE